MRPKQSVNLAEKTNWEIIWSSTLQDPYVVLWRNAAFHIYCNPCVLVACMCTLAPSVMNVLKTYLHLSWFGMMMVLFKISLEINYNFDIQHTCWNIVRAIFTSRSLVYLQFRCLFPWCCVLSCNNKKGKKTLSFLFWNIWSENVNLLH